MPALKCVCHHHESHRHDAKRGDRIHPSIHPSVALAVELTAPGSATLSAAVLDSIDTRQLRTAPRFLHPPNDLESFALYERYLRRVPILGAWLPPSYPFILSISSATFSISERTHSLAICRDTSGWPLGSPARARAKRPLTVRRVPEPWGCRVSSI